MPGAAATRPPSDPVEWLRDAVVAPLCAYPLAESGSPAEALRRLAETFSRTSAERAGTTDNRAANPDFCVGMLRHYLVAYAAAAAGCWSEPGDASAPPDVHVRLSRLLDRQLMDCCIDGARFGIAEKGLQAVAPLDPFFTPDYPWLELAPSSLSPGSLLFAGFPEEPRCILMHGRAGQPPVTVETPTPGGTDYCLPLEFYRAARRFCSHLEPAILACNGWGEPPDQRHLTSMHAAIYLSLPVVSLALSLRAITGTV